jgi:hypothetical protein
MVEAARFTQDLGVEPPFFQLRGQTVEHWAHRGTDHFVEAIGELVLSGLSPSLSSPFLIVAQDLS